MLQMISVVILQVILSVGGLYKIKTAPGIVSWDFVVGFGLYGVSFLTWVYILRAYPLSIAFPLAVSLSIIMSQLIGVLMLEEGWNWLQITAVSIILIGIIILGFSKQISS